MIARFSRTPSLIVMALLIVGAGVGAERAAVIEYEFIDRPAGLPAAFVASRNSTLKFLNITAIDGSRVEAVLSEPDSRPRASSTVIIGVHGSGERYDVSAVGLLVRQLPVDGYSVLAINTRQSGARINTDNFFDIRRDIEAAVYTARALGYRSIVLTVTVWGTSTFNTTLRTTGTRISRPWC